MQFGLLPATPEMPVVQVMTANIGGMEMIIILVVVLILFGGSRLPQLGESLGKSIRNFKKGFSGGDEIDVTPKKQMAAPVDAKILGASDTAQVDRQLADAEARKAEMEAEIAELKERAASKKA